MLSVDAIFWWTGAAVCVAGGAGVAAVVSLWAVDQLARAFRVHGRILRWWQEEGSRKHAEEGRKS